MKKFFYLLAVVGVVLTGCKDNNSPENSAFTFTEDVSKPLEFDGSSAKRALNFTAQADWSVSIQQGTSKSQAKKSPQKAAENSPSWITVSPMSGQKGTQQITISCALNDQNEERSATITISDGKNELKITIVQEALSGDFDVFSAMEDEYFKKCCEIYDTDKDGKLSLKEAKAITEFHVYYEEYTKYFDSYEEYNVYRDYLRKITSFEGIKYFTELEELILDNNTFENMLTVDVSGMKKLKKCRVSWNSLRYVNVSGCTALTELDCSENQLTSLDVSGCTALTELDCYGNQLTSLNVSSCTALTSLSCSSNQLTSLNVIGCTALTSLDCRSNELTSLNVSNCTALTSLSCDGNQLTSLDVSKNTALTWLSCSSNQLTELDVSKNTALEALSCSNNQLTSLDVSKNTALERWLNCYDNQLTSLDVSKHTKLYSLECNSNQLTSLDVSNNTFLGVLVLLPMSTLKTLYLKTEMGYSFYEYIDNKNNRNISIDYIKNAGIEVIYK